MKRIRFLVFAIAAIVFITLLGSIYVLFQAMSDQPLVVDSGTSNTRTLMSVKQEAKLALKQLKTVNQVKTLKLQHDQIAELFIFLDEIFPFLTARYNYSDSQLYVVSSLKLPAAMFGKYLNLSLAFTDQRNLAIGTTTAGDLSFSNDLTFRVSFLIAAVFLDDEIISAMKQLLNGISFSSEELTLTIPAQVDVALLIKQVEKHLKYYRDNSLDSNLTANVQNYYDYLIGLSEYTTGIKEINLTEFLTPLFRESRKISVSGDSAEQNKSALLALALFAGDYNLRSFLNQLLQIDLMTQTYRPNITLADRTDTTLHFIYSAVIHIMSDEIISSKAGELKEILDLGKGGSGFSFIDLAADRAGIAFAIKAVSNPADASRLQLFMSRNNSENAYLPDFSNLKENLDLSVFEKTYANVNSTRYKQVVMEIDRRISQLPLYTSP